MPASQGFDISKAKDYELDHFVPLPWEEICVRRITAGCRSGTASGFQDVQRHRRLDLIRPTQTCLDRRRPSIRSDASVFVSHRRSRPSLPSSMSSGVSLASVISSSPVTQMTAACTEPYIRDGSMTLRNRCRSDAPFAGVNVERAQHGCSCRQPSHTGRDLPKRTNGS